MINGNNALQIEYKERKRKLMKQRYEEKHQVKVFFFELGALLFSIISMYLAMVIFFY